MYSKNWIFAWLALLPALALLTLFTYVPMVSSVLHTLFSFDKTPEGLSLSFSAKENIEYLITDTTFVKAMKNNLIYAVVTIPASIVIAFTMAMWVNKKMVGRGFLRLSYFIPTMLPMIAAANIWLFFYTPNIGLLNRVLGFFGIAAVNWLGDPSTSLGAITMIAIWKEAGFFMIFYLAALQNIPGELLDAAKLESNKRFYVLRRVIWPLLTPTTLFIMINALINAFKLIDQLFILTKGGPDDSSMLLLYYTYITIFEFGDINYASTQTLVLLIILMLASALQFYFSRKRVHYR